MALLLQQAPRASIDFDALRSISLVSVVSSSVKLHRAGREFKGCCPFHEDRSPSFYVIEDKGFAHCFGCGWHGDVVDFVAAIHGVGIRDAAEMLGGGALPVAPRRPIPAGVDPEQDRSGEALAIWQNAVPAAGTPAEAYLRNRGITIPLPDSIRFARLPLGRRPIMPALVALVVDVNGTPCGIQRAYLTEDGSKANLPGGKVKFSLGRVRGGAIRLAPIAVELMVCEGLEDGLSLQQLAGRGAWAAAGAGMLPAMQLPSIVRSVVIGADADEAGEKAARAAADTFAAQDRAARIIRPVEGVKDFNQELQEAR